MSHLKERKEKNCLNCNASLHGRYCHICGQENLEPKETVWHLITHFFNDITHFDGKFFNTVKYLITKPGFLSKEYVVGRRASYLNPIRMYVFTSAIFFLVFFSLNGGDKIVNLNETPDKNAKTTEIKESVGDWENQKKELEKKILLTKDQGDIEDLKDSIGELAGRIAAAKKIYGDTTTKKFNLQEISLLSLEANMDSLKAQGMPPAVAAEIDSSVKAHSRLKSDTNDITNRYKTVAAYDSAQQKLPENKRDGWFSKLMNRKIILIGEQWHKDKKSYLEHIKENFVHSFPKILFFLLPFFALILKLVYVRRKQFYYTDHAIFTIHLYCAVFIFLLILIILNKLLDSMPWHWASVVETIINFIVWIYLGIYTYKAMRTFYQQKRLKTIIKLCIVSLLAFIINVILLAIFLLISAIST